MSRRALLAGGALALPVLRTLAASRAHAQDFTQVPLPPDAARADPLHAFWDSLPREFPQRDGLLYFNTAGLGIPPFEVLARLQEVALEAATQGETLRSTHFEAARAAVARAVGAAPEEIALTRNATEAMNVVARGVRLARGDEIVLSTHEHPGGAAPWIARAQDDGLHLRLVDLHLDPEADGRALWKLVGRRTRGIVVSHVLSTLGGENPVREWTQEAHRRGLWFAVDGAQAAGLLDLDLHALGVDFYVASGHKWLLGPLETGFLYVRRERLHEVAPRFVGAYSAEASGYSLEELRFQCVDTARRFEYGTRSPAQAAGLTAALEWAEALGRDVARARSLALAARFAERAGGLPGVQVLTPEPAWRRVPIVTFRIPARSNTQVAEWFQTQMGIRVRVVGEHGLNAVRASFHLVNRVADVDWFAEGVRVLAG